ncbi:MAG: hypothetical protein IT357_16190 [Gemmatimonadaceae bacterium]|nr:hypothetical protein [Gemmatimonadaceae bacterium]
MGALFPLAFLVAIGGLVTLGVGLSVYQKRAAQRLTDEGADERLAMLEARLEALEQRADSTERTLGRGAKPRELQSGDSE